MNTLTRSIAFGLLVLWGLAISHCDLEHVPGFEFLACCQHPETAPHEDNDCEEDACAVVESGLYKMEEQAASAPTPLVWCVFLGPLWVATVPSIQREFECSSSAPPELAVTWQFSFRTAPSPRAPSFVS